MPLRLAQVLHDDPIFPDHEHGYAGNFEGTMLGEHLC